MNTRLTLQRFLRQKILPPGCKIGSINRLYSWKDAKSQMLTRRRALDEKRDSYEFGGRRFTPREVEQNVDRRLQQYDDTAVQLAAKERILEARQQTLNVAAEKIRQHQQQYDLLVQKAANLKADLRLADLEQQGGSFAFNSDRLNEAKRVSRELEARIRTVQKLVEGQCAVRDEIPVEADTRPITARYDEYFAQSDAQD